MPFDVPAASAKIARMTTTKTRLADQLVSELEQRVFSGELQPGSRFPTEMAIVESTGISRTVVREAFARMAAKGLLISRRGSGAYVAATAHYQAFQITQDELTAIDDLHRLFEMRTPFEAEMAELAAARRTDEDLAAMSDSIDALIGSANVDAAVAADTAFHAAIARATRNNYFLRFTEFLGIRMVPPRTVYLRNTDDVPREEFVRAIADDHNAIFVAIRRQDPAAARGAARAHMYKSIERHELIRGDFSPASGD
jgi:GntR family transcriptional regulator, transcriptional repressor for pyruvate dehydrogenase complex